MSDRERFPTWIKVLVGFHVFAITTWTIPPPPPQAEAEGHQRTPIESFLVFNKYHVKTQPSYQYLQSLGLWQAWDMFAPNPSFRDVWSEAGLVYRSGQTKDVTFPRMQEMSIPQKYVMERFRKYNERASHEDFAYLWPTLCQWLARENSTNPNDPVVRVYLKRHVRITPTGVTAKDYFAGFNSRQGMEKWIPQNPPLEANYTDETIFEWVVDLVDLAKTKGWPQ